MTPAVVDVFAFIDFYSHCVCYLKIPQYPSETTPCVNSSSPKTLSWDIQKNLPSPQYVKSLKFFFGGVIGSFGSLEIRGEIRGQHPSC